MKKIKIEQSGPSLPVLVGNGGSSEWVLAVTGGVEQSTNLKLEASVNNEDWFSATSDSGDVIFTKPSAVLVSSGLYYRVNVGAYSSPISLQIKPN